MPYDFGGYSDFDWGSLGVPNEEEDNNNFDLGSFTNNDFSGNSLSSFLGGLNKISNPSLSSPASFDIPGSNPNFGSSQIPNQIPNQGPSPDSTPSAMDEFRQHIEDMPTRGDYKPGLWRTLGGMGLAAGTAYSQGPAAGYKVGRSFLDEPYNNAVQDWSSKGKALEKLSDDERMNMYQTGQIKLRGQSNAMRADMNQARKQSLLTKSGLDEARTKDIMDGKTDIIKTRDGYATVNKKTKEVTPLGVDDKSMSPDEKIEFQKMLDEMTTSRQLKVANVYGANAQSLENTRQTNRETNAENAFSNKERAVQEGLVPGVGPNKKVIDTEVKPGSSNEQRLRSRAFVDTISSGYTKYSAILDQTADGRYVINPEKASQNPSIYQDLISTINSKMKTYGPSVGRP